MKQVSTLFLKAVVVIIGLLVLAVCIFVLPAGITSDKTGYYAPILIGLYIPAIPFFFALYQTMKLLGNIDTNKAFSELSVRILKNIKYCAIIISGLCSAGMTYIYYAAERDEAPGVILSGVIIIGASTVIATFAAVLHRLLQDALEIKSENDLTV